MVFVCIIYSINKHSRSKQVDNYEFLRRNVVTAVVLVVTFGLAWVIGFLATTGLPEAIRLGGLIIFTVIVAFHGVFFFLLHTARSKDIRQHCLLLYHIVTCQSKKPGSIGTSSYQGTARRVSTSSTPPTGPTSTRRTSTSSTASVSSDFGTLRPQIPPSLAEVPEEEEEVEEESCRLSPQPKAAMESTTGGRGSLVMSNVALTEEIELVDLEAGKRDSLVVTNLALETAMVGQDEGEGERRDSTPNLSSLWEEEGEWGAVHTVSIRF